MVITPGLEFSDNVEAKRWVSFELAHVLIKGLDGFIPGCPSPFVRAAQDMFSGFFVYGTPWASGMVPHLPEPHTSAHAANTHGVLRDPAPLPSGECQEGLLSCLPVDAVEFAVGNSEFVSKVRL